MEVEITNKNDWTATSLNEYRSYQTAAQTIDGAEDGEPYNSKNTQYGWLQVID